MSDFGPDLIRHALATARARGFRQVSVSSGPHRFRAVLSDSVEAHVEEPEPEGAEKGESVPVLAKAVVSPVVGYFRAADPPVETGTKVKQGQTIGTVVALGITNDVVADEDCEVAEVCVHDGEAVEFGQSIALVRN
ncbi:MAG TPA: biotin/lipoyl-containing protein [Fimbriimonadaceae bacterium]|nr:biotin/lipoyl-containing protein [Fimbriimonadaceae bacterium]